MNAAILAIVVACAAWGCGATSAPAAADASAAQGSDADAGDVDAAADATPSVLPGDATAGGGDAVQADAVADALGDAGVFLADAGPDVATDASATADALADADAQPLAADASTCFVGSAAPEADAAVADVPPPAPCPAEPPGFFPGETVPAPTLAPEIGWHDGATGAFHAYVDGGWARIEHGTQGLTHVILDYRVAIPGQPPGPVKVKAQNRGYLECVGVNAGVAFSSQVQATQTPGLYENTPGTNQLVLSLPGNQSYKVCGKWLTLDFGVRASGTSAWGTRRLTVRLYDAIATAPAP